MKGNAFGNNPKTTLAGLAMLIMGVIAIVNNPKLFSDTEKSGVVVTQIVTGLGLIVARDSKEQDPVRPPVLPPPPT